MIDNDLLHLRVDTLFKDASIIIMERTLAKGITYDPITGAVDLYGALLLAAGAKPKSLCSESVHPQDLGIPAFKHAQIEAAFALLEETIANPDLWSDTATTQEARMLLLKCCDIAKSEKRK
jgi:hypothetical protein